MDLLRLQCATHDSANGAGGRRDNAAWTGNNWSFELCYFLFDAGVTLMSGFSKMPVEARAQEARELIQRSIEILEDVGWEGRGEDRILNGGTAKREIAIRAGDVLNILGRELGWRHGAREMVEQKNSGFSTKLPVQASPPPSAAGPAAQLFGFIPQSPLPGAMDTSNSTPLSIFFSPSFVPQTDFSQSPLWSDSQYYSGRDSVDGVSYPHWDLLQ
jgi:hypothetical protein